MTPFDNCPTVGMYSCVVDGELRWIVACSEFAARVHAVQAWPTGVHQWKRLPHIRDGELLDYITFFDSSHEDYFVDLVVLP